jgi:ribonuclease HII
MPKKSVQLEIIDDDEEEEVKQNSLPKKREKKLPVLLNKYYFDNSDILEIGVDESGRGPLFGRVYTASVILPKDDSFDHTKMKDSKLFHSKKKICEVSEYIKKNAIAWSISYEDEKVIDKMNILQATQKSMHTSITACYMMSLEKNKHLLQTPAQTLQTQTQTQINNLKVHLLIDGNYFNSYTQYNKVRKMMESVPHTCIEGGDNKYTCIAAASILAKVARDEYIEKLCEENPDLSEKYGINKNKGYGAKKHLDGIKEHGITEWHRKTFGICKKFVNNE